MKLIFTLIALSFTLIVNAQVNLGLGVVACYPLDGALNDTTSNAFNLTANGSPTVMTDRFGNPSGAYELVALNGDYLDGGYDALLSPGELTLSAWVYLVNTMNDQKIAGKASVGAGYLMGVDTNKIDAEIWDMMGTHFRIKGGVVSPNTWTHLAISFRQSDYLRIYVNGMIADSLASDAFAAGSPSMPFIIGGAPWQPTALNMSGDIDDVILYNRSLNSDEIFALYSFVTGTINGESSIKYAGIYPVPLTSDMLTITLNKNYSGEGLINVYDVSGQKVLGCKYDHSEKLELNLAGLNAGLYSVSIISDGKIENHKLIKY
jgi:hypothetical protein